MRVRIVIRSATCRSVAQYFFLAIGVTCLGLYGAASLERVLYQGYESLEFDQSRARYAATFVAPAAGTAPVRRKSVSPPRAPLPTALVGRLSIPRLHWSAMVREGADGNTLQLAVGHIPGTAQPGQAGNVGLAGHRDTFFRELKDLRPQDEIQFSTLNGDFKYVVESLSIVDPDNVGVLAPSAENVLTLITCYPFFYIGAAPRRFVVRARQVATQTAPSVTVE